MKTLKNYLHQPSTWLGLAKLGAALGLYSTGVGGAIGTAVMGGSIEHQFQRGKLQKNQTTQLTQTIIATEAPVAW